MINIGDDNNNNDDINMIDGDDFVINQHLLFGEQKIGIDAISSSWLDSFSFFSIIDEDREVALAIKEDIFPDPLSYYLFKPSQS